MIVSKAMRNIRQKIDFTSVDGNAGIPLWNPAYNGVYEAADERLDGDSMYALDTVFFAVTGGSLTEEQWHSYIATYGDTGTLANFTAWITGANAPGLSVVYHTSASMCASTETKFDAKYLSFDFNTTPFALTASLNFSTLVAAILNLSGSNMATGSIVYTFVELTPQDLIDAGVPLINNGNGTYRVNFKMQEISFKISEDV